MEVVYGLWRLSETRVGIELLGQLKKKTPLKASVEWGGGLRRVRKVSIEP